MEKLEEKLPKEVEVKEEVKEDPAKAKRKSANATMQRSDSTGSQSGRTLLAPTLSDPQARHEKDRFPGKKKSGQKHQISPQNNATTKLEVNRFVMPTNHQNNSVFEVHDWWHEQVTYTNSSDDEE